MRCSVFAGRGVYKNGRQFIRTVLLFNLMIPLFIRTTRFTTRKAQPLWLRFFAESGGFFGALFPYRGPFFVEKSRELCGSCIRQSPFILYENRVNSTFLYWKRAEKLLYLNSDPAVRVGTWKGRHRYETISCRKDSKHCFDRSQWLGKDFISRGPAV